MAKRTTSRRSKAAKQSTPGSADAVWQEFGKMNQWDLRDYSHTLPEWRDPKGSSLPIEIRDILLGEGFSEEEAREVLDTLNAEEFAARLSDA
jgi:hypothetical protein